MKHSQFKTLIEILSVKRGHGGKGEHELCELVWAFGDAVPQGAKVFKDDAGSVAAYAITTDAESKTLFCSHLDTVHHEEGFNELTISPDGSTVHAKGAPLGADDGAGVWLMLEMIKLGVPGTYLFHRGEECGGIGSRVMASRHSDFLSGFERAIAFDRKGTSSVITYQYSCGRCCSDEFADALAAALTDDTYFWAPDDTGVFTDTANYTHVIPECTNLSIGYQNEHSNKESLDLNFLNYMLKACCAVDWENLPTTRKPGESCDMGYYTGSYTKHWRSDVPTLDDVFGMTDEEIANFVYDYPDEAAVVMSEIINYAFAKESFYE